MDIQYIHRVQFVDKKWECIIQKVVNDGLNDGQVGVNLNAGNVAAPPYQSITAALHHPLQS